MDPTPAADPTTEAIVTSPLEPETAAQILDFGVQPPSVWQRRLKILSHFFAGQTLVQALNFFVGFVLLRWMDVASYAQYNVAFAFQSTVAMLVDLGFTASIIALVGDRSEDMDVVGRYIRSARYFRTRFFIVILGGATVAYPFAVSRQAWGWQIKLLLYIGVVVSLAADNWLMYSSVLLMRRQIKPYYRSQVVAGIYRQVTITVLYLAKCLNSWTASWTSAIASAVYAWMYRKAALPLIRVPKSADPATNREMLRYIAPLMPGMVFSAFQGQISIALITFFGKTQNIAEVGALGRLAQIFILFSTFNQVVIEPYIARIPRVGLAKRYLEVVASQILLGALLTSVAFVFPGLLIWIIGPKYAHLRAEVGWVAMVASLNYLSGGLWTMNSARRWIYWWGTGFYICSLILTQIVAAMYLDLSKTHEVVLFSLCTTVSLVFTHAVHGIYGFRFGPAKQQASQA